MARSKKSTREPSKMVRVDEAMEILSVSKSTAYHTIQKFNNELRAKGYEVPGAAFLAAISCSGAAYERRRNQRAHQRDSRPPCERFRMDGSLGEGQKKNPPYRRVLRV